MEAKLKHLEFIQSTINRMAGNSFLLKGWSVTIIGGLLAFSFKEMDRHYVYISFAVLCFFWLLDSYYLSRERHFIKLYDRVRKINEDAIDFSMDTGEFRGTRGCDWIDSAFSKTIIIFYGGLTLVHFFIIHIL
jgi:uncharacterized membrane protein